MMDFFLFPLGAVVGFLVSFIWLEKIYKHDIENLNKSLAITQDAVQSMLNLMARDG
jgi:hypothetical protein